MSSLTHSTLLRGATLDDLALCPVLPSDIARLAPLRQCTAASIAHVCGSHHRRHVAHLIDIDMAQSRDFGCDWRSQRQPHRQRKAEPGMMKPAPGPWASRAVLFGPPMDGALIAAPTVAIPTSAIPNRTRVASGMVKSGTSAASGFC